MSSLSVHCYQRQLNQKTWDKVYAAVAPKLKKDYVYILPLSHFATHRRDKTVESESTIGKLTRFRSIT